MSRSDLLLHRTRACEVRSLGSPVKGDVAQAPVKKSFTSTQEEYLAFIPQYLELLGEGNRR